MDTKRVKEELRAPKLAPDLLFYQFSAAIRPVFTRNPLRRQLDWVGNQPRDVSQNRIANQVGSD